MTKHLRNFKCLNVCILSLYIPTSELIDLYYAQTRLDPILSTKFNITYYMLASSKVDEIIEWLYKTSERYSIEGDSVFVL